MSSNLKISGDSGPIDTPHTPLSKKDELLTIGALAQQCGITVRTLRYYEEIDLIGPTKRSTGKYRLYSQHALKRVQAIQALQALNYSLEDILVTLGSFSKKKDLTKVEQRQATQTSLQKQLGIIDDKLKQLTALREELLNRLSELNEHCNPCSSPNDSVHCSEDCAHAHIHT